ncbi:hypothetical protein KGQ20_23255 [Catenulispora sp. NF23]|uniref:Uncharacterized protein n=1 Tax=Catenulispora pinistramenti TaxID=2705254 RepID=A0ABS5KNA6_9ACTN|nr:hypothetical protein [Catenulispora pinistramenti]MBS2535684.1 hypothetical protein [Catenulispora pinistramenti]MBS2547543.1 hypothetical protein [Catenulispora pinistramenti]
MGESAAVPQLDPADGGDDEPFLGLAWAEAIEATELLRSALAALGLAGEIPRLRGDVNVYGRPMVTVGRINPTAARRLAAALSRAAQHQPRIYGQAQPAAGETAPGCGLPGPGGPGGGANGAAAGNGPAGEPHRSLRPPRTATPLNLPVAVPMATVLPMAVPPPMATPGAPPAATTATAATAPGSSPADSIRLPA